MTILCGGCCIWHPSGSSSTGTPDARIGTWFSVNWRSCSPTGRQADPLALGFPGGRDGIHAVRRAYRPILPGKRQPRGISPIMHMDHVIFLILSKNAYTKYSGEPAHQCVCQFVLSYTLLLALTSFNNITWQPLKTTFWCFEREILFQQKFWKVRNTWCIVDFSKRIVGAKDPLKTQKGSF